MKSAPRMALKALVNDNWINIQEPDVLVGRLLIFNNWSPYMVADHSKTSISLEYVCLKMTPPWRKSEEDMIQLAKEEMARIRIVDSDPLIGAP